MALPAIPSKPYDAELLKILYDGGYVVTTDFPVDTAATTVLQDATIEAFRALWPFADETAFNTAVDSLKIDIAADAATTVTPIVDVLEQVRADYVTLAQANSLTNSCPQCQTAGYTTEDQILGNGSTTLVESSVCEGYGYTAVAQTPVLPLTYQDI